MNSITVTANVIVVMTDIDQNRKCFGENGTSIVLLEEGIQEIPKLTAANDPKVNLVSLERERERCHLFAIGKFSHITWLR